MKLEDIKKSQNIAEDLEEELLVKIAQYVSEGYRVDCESRRDWQNLVDKSMKIAKQTYEVKNDPFPGCANVKFPLISQAVIDFAARQYPQMIQNNRVARTTVVGSDPENIKAEQAERVSQCISYQLINKSTRWEEEMDHLLHVLPMVGTCFKKTYFDPITKQPVSELCVPENVVVNNNIKSLELAPRITHVIYLSNNDIRERIALGIFKDVDMSRLYDGAEMNAEEMDEPIELLECHCTYDCDEDGYREPYIITIHNESRQVLRVVQRFEEIQKTKDGSLLRIVPEQYFIDYHFIRSLDGTYYSFGFGTLLFPLNESINTVVNQLLDAGTLNNYQSGFIGSALRLKNGNYRLNLNEWKVIQTPAGSRIQDNIVPLPTKEPSMTLLNLLQLLIDVGRDLTSTNDLMQGKGQTQNVPATTVLSMIEQGMKVYTAISKRLFLSQKKEFNRIFYLNYKHLSNKDYQDILDMPGISVKRDFDCKTMDIYPVADASMSTETQRMAKAQAILSLPTVDSHEATIEFLQSLQIDKQQIEKLAPAPDPNAPPPPEVQKTMAEVGMITAQAQLFQTEAQVKPVETQLEVVKGQQDAKESDSRIMESAARIGKMQHDAVNNNAKSQIEAIRIQKESELNHAKMILDTSVKHGENDVEVKKLLIEYQKVQNDAKKASD